MYIYICVYTFYKLNYIRIYENQVNELEESARRSLSCALQARARL